MSEPPRKLVPIEQAPHAIRREYLLRARRNHRIALAAVGTLLAALVWGVAQFFR